MKRLGVLGLFVLSHLGAQQPITIEFTMPPSLKGVDLYDLIGLNKAEYNAQKAKAQQEAEQKAAADLQAQRDRLKAAVDKAERELSVELAAPMKIKFQVEAKREALRKAQGPYQKLIEQQKQRAQKYLKQNAAFNSWAQRNIQSACKATRSKLNKEIESLESEMQMYPQERFPLSKRITDLKNKLKQTAEGCSFLMNPQYRAEYDERLEWAATPERVGEAYEEVKELVESKMRLAGTGTRVFLNELMGDLLSKVDIPGPAFKLFSQDIALTNIHVLPKPYGEDIKYYIGFSGTTDINNFTLTVNVYIIWDIYNKVRWSVSVATPEDYRITNLLPSLKALNWMVFPQGKLLVSSFNGTDAEGFPFKKGLNFLGQWNIFSGPLSFFKKLQAAAPKLEGLIFDIKPIQVSGQIPKNPFLSSFSAKLPLYLGIDFTKIGKLPKTFTNVINKVSTEAFELAIKPYQRSVQERLPELQDKLSSLRIAMFEAQKNYNQVKALAVKGQEARLEEFERAYFDAKTKYEQAVEQVDKAKEATKKEKEKKEERVPFEKRSEEVATAAVESAKNLGFIVEAQSSGLLYLGTQRNPLRIVFTGKVIPPGLKYPQGFISLSAQLQNMIEFGWLAIGNAAIVLDCDLAVLDVLIWFGVPISGFFINGQVDLGKPGISRASLKVGGGLSIAATQAIDNVVFDVSAENIRPTDFVRYLGYQLLRSKYAQRGTAKLTAQGEKLFQKVLPKGIRIPRLSLPEVVFHKVWGYASLGDATIGTRTYRTGLGLQLEFELMKQKAGFRIFIGKRGEGYYLEGFGYGPPLSVTVRGKNIFRLYSSQDPSKGPSLSWNFNPQELFKGMPEASQLVQEGFQRAKKDIEREGMWGVDGVLEVPVFGIKQKVLFAWSQYSISGEFESEVAGFSLLFGFNTDTLEGESMLAGVESKLWERDPNDYRTIAARTLLARAKELGIEDVIEAQKKSDGEERTKDLNKIKEKGGTPLLAIQLLSEANQLLKVAPTAKTAAIIEEEVSPEASQKAQQLTIFAEKVAEIKASDRKQLPPKSMLLISQYDAFVKNKKAIIDKDSKDSSKAVTALKTTLEQSVGETLSTIKTGIASAVSAALGTLKEQGTVFTFGFTNMNELSKKITEQMVPALEKAKESLLKKIKALDEKAERWREGKIDPTKEREAIAAREAEIAQKKEECRKRPSGIRRAACEGSIKKQQFLLGKDKVILKAFIESKLSKNVKRVAAIGYQKSRVGKALKAVAEKVLNSITAAASAIAKGIDILKLQEVQGRYSSSEWKEWKLPQLVLLRAEINIEGKSIPIVLYNLQFDFKNPFDSLKSIGSAISGIFTKTISKEFLSELPALAALVEGEVDPMLLEGSF